MGIYQTSVEEASSIICTACGQSVAGPQEVIHCRGDLSFVTTDTTLEDMTRRWTWSGDRSYAPRCIDDVELAREEFQTFLPDLINFILESTMNFTSRLSTMHE